MSWRRFSTGRWQCRLNRPLRLKWGPYLDQWSATFCQRRPGKSQSRIPPSPRSKASTEGAARLPCRRATMLQGRGARRTAEQLVLLPAVGRRSFHLAKFAGQGLGLVVQAIDSLLEAAVFLMEP